MKALLKTKTQTGIEGTLFADNGKLVLSVNGKTAELFGIATLNPNEVTLTKYETEKLFGIARTAKLQIVSFADGSEIPTGNIVQVNDLIRRDILDKDAIISDIKKEKKQITIPETPKNLPMDTYSRMMREGFDSIES